MASGATLGAGLVLVATVYRLVQSDVLERLWGMMTGQRAITLGGFGLGLVYGDIVLKAALGAVGAAGTLALGDVIDLSGTQFAVLVVGVIVFVMLSRGEALED